MKRAIILFSGGLDSTSCLYWAKDKYDAIILLSFLYGSKEDQVIEKTNKKFQKLLSLESKIISIPFLKEFSQSTETTLIENGDIPPVFSNFNELDNKDLTTKSARQVWIPGRNILFLSIAASFADSFSEPIDIIFGANKEEGQTFPDNTQKFITRMNKAITLGCLNDVKILAPFVNQSKLDMVLFLHNKNVPYEFSSSCYSVQGWTKDNKPIHCGRCESCLRRKRAFNTKELKDKTIYRTP